MKIVFFGTPEFAAAILDVLVQAQIDIAAIVTKPDKPQGRSAKLIAPSVKQKALQLVPQVPIFQPEKCSTPEFTATLSAIHADLFVVVAYGEILKQEILDLPRLGCINVHASLLPKYRGAAPIQRALIHGEKETGISIIKLVKKMDAGDVIKMASLPIAEAMTYPELETALSSLGSTLLLEVISDLEHNRAEFTPQDHDKATFADKIQPKEYEINWSKPARDIHNLVRALSSHPGAYSFATIRGNKRRIKFLRTLPSHVSLDRGVVKQIENRFLIGCESGSLEVLELQMEGKPVMRAAEFFRGHAVNDVHF